MNSASSAPPIIVLNSSSHAWQAVKDLIVEYDEPIIVCQEYVWYGSDFGQRISSLIEDLNRRTPDWAACGNRGCSWDGQDCHDYTSFTRKLGAGLETANTPKVVLSVDDNLLLINCAQLRKVDLVDLPNTRSRIFGIPLSLECLRHHLPVFVDPRLFTVRAAAHSPEDITEFVALNEFQSYYRSNFINHKFAWPDGELDLSNCIDYGYVTEPNVPYQQVDLIGLFDSTLQRLRGKSPSVTICCRTQFRRLEMLERAITSFSIAEIASRGKLKLEATLITDCPPEAAVSHLRTFQAKFPLLGLQCWTHVVREPRSSRTDLILAAIERAETDYIWFVDDDDYVLPGAPEALARTLIPAEETIVVGNSLQMYETWLDGAFVESKLANRFSSRKLYNILSGANHVPVCGYLLPLSKAKSILSMKRALGDYYEDYFILLSFLCAPRADVRLLDADLAAVSIRDTGNTVTQTDRSQWNSSLATFMQEILCDADRSPILWQLAKRLAT
jgi:hypothetical protein